MKEIRGQPKKWITLKEYVDLETGEIISKSKYQREYYKVKESYKIEITEHGNYKKYTTECRPTRQTKLQI